MTPITYNQIAVKGEVTRIDPEFRHWLASLLFTPNDDLRYEYSDAPYTVRDDKDLAILAVIFDAANIKFVSKRLKKDRDVVLAMIRSKSFLLKLIPKEMCDDKEIVIEALETGTPYYRDDFFNRLPDRLRKDPDILSYYSVKIPSQKLPSTFTDSFPIPSTFPQPDVPPILPPPKHTNAWMSIGHDIWETISHQMAKHSTDDFKGIIRAEHTRKELKSLSSDQLKKILLHMNASIIPDTKNDIIDMIMGND